MIAAERKVTNLQLALEGKRTLDLPLPVKAETAIRPVGSDAEQLHLLRPHFLVGAAHVENDQRPAILPPGQEPSRLGVRGGASRR